MMLRLNTMKTSGDVSHSQIQSCVLIFKIRNIASSWRVGSWGKRTVVSWILHWVWWVVAVTHFQRVSLIHVVSLYLMEAVAREPGPLSPEEFDLIPLTNTNTGTINFGCFTKQKPSRDWRLSRCLLCKHEHPGLEHTCVKGDMPL